MAYRDLTSSSWTEVELWQRLDEALAVSLTDPTWAWSIAWWIVMDSRDFPDVRRAVTCLMSELTGTGRT